VTSSLVDSGPVRVNPTVLGRSFRRVRHLVLPALRAAVNGLPESARAVAGYHFGWRDEAGQPAPGRPGKLLRPALTLLSAQAVGGRPDRAVDPAVAVELAYNFALIHDDLADGDLVRRHRPSTWSRFGPPAAIRAGEALLIRATQMLVAAPDSVAILTGAVQDLIEGQSLADSFEQRDEITVDEYLAMAGGRTAALLACACELGAVHGGGTPWQAEALRRFGWHLGLAYQLVEDLLGIWGSAAVTSRPARSDLRAGRKTFPVVAARQHGGERGRRLRELYPGPEPLAEPELDTVAELVERAGGRAWTRAEADRHMYRARHWLAEAEPAPDAQETLLAIAALVTLSR
jgi:geranylgeranyl diphosphate synthase type I